MADIHNIAAHPNFRAAPDASFLQAIDAAIHGTDKPDRSKTGLRILFSGREDMATTDQEHSRLHYERAYFFDNALWFGHSGGVSFFVKRPNGRNEWITIQAETDDRAYNFGWNGKRFSLVPASRLLNRLHPDALDDLRKCLSGLSADEIWQAAYCAFRCEGENLNVGKWPLAGAKS